MQYTEEMERQAFNKMALCYSLDQSCHAIRHIVKTAYMKLSIRCLSLTLSSFTNRKKYAKSIWEILFGDNLAGCVMKGKVIT